MLFHALESAFPGSFISRGVPIVEGRTPGDVLGTLLYFSSVTLTTLGYGDVAPATEQARSLAVGEPLIGQVYLAVFVARLVTMFRPGERAG